METEKDSDPYTENEDGSSEIDELSPLNNLPQQLLNQTLHHSSSSSSSINSEGEQLNPSSSAAELISALPPICRRFQLEKDDHGQIITKCRKCNSRKVQHLYKSRQNIFVEMIEFEPEKWVWNETARWLRFEEDVEEGGQWSKPHVCLVPLHSLEHLREILKDAVIMLDFDVGNIEHIFRQMLNAHVKSKRIDSVTAGRCLNMLSLSHFHQNAAGLEGKGFVHSLADFGSRAAAAITRGVSHSKMPLEKCQTESGFGEPIPSTSQSKSKPRLSVQYKKGVGIDGNLNKVQKVKINRHLQKKLPTDTESVSIMVGACQYLQTPICAFVRLSSATFLADLTELSLPTRFVFILLIPDKTQSIYHDVGRSISAIMCNEMSSFDMYHAKNEEDVIEAVDHFLDHALAIPPNDWDIKHNIDPPDGHHQNNDDHSPPEDLPTTFDYKCEPELHPDPILERTHRCFGGLVDDVKRSLSFYRRDIVNAFDFRCLTSIIFMYFACLSPIVTFGGLLSRATNNNMGAIESLVAGVISGTIYHAFAGQPLTIIGSTGPVLVFETMINTYCESNQLDFMGIRVWIGIWITLILLVIVATDGCVLIKYITRFTEESFAALIGSIFIYEAIQKMYDLYRGHPFDVNKNLLNSTTFENSSCLKRVVLESERYNSSASLLLHRTCSVQLYPDVFWFSLFLFLFTFFGMVQLKAFKNSRYFPTKIRNIVSNFAALIVFTITVCIDHYFAIETPKLLVPSTFRTTKHDRGWFISPFGRIHVGYMFVTLFPAFLATVLIFMDQNISSVIVNRRENKLKKGGGYHLDMLIIAICILINSLLGLPWFVAATVLSMNHVISLKLESKCVMPGEKPAFDGVIEQRVTGFVVFVLIGLSVLLTPLLMMIPMPVLYGLFLYMGVSSLAEIQFWHRLKLLFMTSKSRPDFSFVRHVNIRKVNLFTCIQLLCTIALWAIKSNPHVSMVFPLMVAALVFVRIALTHVFTEREMSFLDDYNPDAKKLADEDEVKAKQKSSKLKFIGHKNKKTNNSRKRGGPSNHHITIEIPSIQIE